jgi:hypothetical protein
MCVQEFHTFSRFATQITPKINFLRLKSLCVSIEVSVPVSGVSDIMRDAKSPECFYNRPKKKEGI